MEKMPDPGKVEVYTDSWQKCLFIASMGIEYVDTFFHTILLCTAVIYLFLRLILPTLDDLVFLINKDFETE